MGFLHLVYAKICHHIDKLNFSYDRQGGICCTLLSIFLTFCTFCFVAEKYCVNYEVLEWLEAVVFVHL